MLAGGCGAFVGTPAEVALVRMTADGRLPEAERRNYKSVVDALVKITKQEGVLQLWRGAIPTMGRSMVVNGAQLASYSQAKEFLMSTGELPDDTGGVGGSNVIVWDFFQGISRIILCAILPAV